MRVHGTHSGAGVTRAENDEGRDPFGDPDQLVVRPPGLEPGTCGLRVGSYT
jgi:hypothetical protein